MSTPDAAQRAPRMSPFHWCVFIFVATLCAPAAHRFPANPEVYKAGYALVGALIMMTWLLARGVRGQHALEIPRLFAWLALFVGWAAVTLLWAPNRYYGFEELLEYLTALMIFVLVSNVLINEAALVRLLNLLFVSALVLALLAFAQYWFALDWVQRALRGPAATFGNQNFFMQYLVLIAPLGLALMTAAPTRVTLALYTVGLTLIYATFSITLTRAAIVAGVVQLVLFGPLYALSEGGDRRCRLRGFAVVAGIVVSTAVALGASELSDFDTRTDRLGARFSGAGQALSAPPPQALFASTGGVADPVMEVASKPVVDAAARSVADRLRYWTSTYHMILEHGLAGVGLGNWRVYYPKFAPEERDRRSLFLIYNAHNSWLETVAATGLPGLLLMLGIVASGALALRTSLRAPGGDKALLIGVALGLVGAGVNALFSAVFDKTVPLLIISAYLAVLALSAERQSGRSWRCDLSKCGRLKWPLLVVMVVLCERALAFSAARVNEEVLFIQASVQSRQKNWTQVEELAAGAIARNPLSNRGYAFKGFAALYQGRPRDGAEALAIFLRTEPYNFNALVNYAKALYDAGEIEGALAVTLRCLELRPTARAMMLTAAVLYQNLGDTDKARQYQLRAQAR